MFYRAQVGTQVQKSIALTLSLKPCKTNNFFSCLLTVLSLTHARSTRRVKILAFKGPSHPQLKKFGSVDFFLKAHAQIFISFFHLRNISVYSLYKVMKIFTVILRLDLFNQQDPFIQCHTNIIHWGRFI